MRTRLSTSPVPPGSLCHRYRSSGPNPARVTSRLPVRAFPWIMLLLLLVAGCGGSDGSADPGGEDHPGQDPAAPCILELVDTGVRLDPDPEGRFPDPVRGVAMDGDGRFLTLTSTPGTLALWGAEGGFQAVVGRPGDGPQEFGLISAVLAGLSGTFHVIHDDRWSMVTPSLEVIPVTRSPLLFSERSQGVAVAHGGRLLVPGWEPGGPVAMLLGTNGEVEREFGKLPASSPPLLLPPGLAHWPGESTFVAGPILWTDSSYVLERWSLDGELVDRWERTAEWIGVEVGAGADVPIVGRIGLHLPGIIHLSASLPNPALRVGAEGMEGSPRWPRFELLESETGSLLASGWYGFSGSTVGEMWGRIPGSGLTYRIVTTSDGLERLEILRMELRDRPRSEAGECADGHPLPLDG